MESKSHADTPARKKAGKVYIEPAIRSIAGSLITIVGLLLYFSDELAPVWLAILLFLGFNLFQSGLTNFCLMEKLLKIFRLTSELDEIRALSGELKVKSDQQAIYLDTLKLLNEAVIGLSPEGRILTASEGWARLIETHRVQSTADQPLIAYVAESDRHLLARLLNLLEHQPDRTKRINFRLNARNKKTKWISANFMLTDHGGEQTIKGVLSDISEVKRLEEKQRKFEQELTHARRLSSLGEMAAGLAHELNQPLAAINLYIQGCLQRLNTDSGQAREITDAMKAASAQARRAGNIIEQIRNFVRKAPLNKSDTDVNLLINDAIQLLDIDPDAQETTFHYELDTALPLLPLDRLQIKQVLVNLIQNAIESMKGLMDRKTVTLRTHKVDDNIVVEIEDRGSGVPENISTQLFEPFVTGREDGLGLGLAICQSIVEQHGGKLWYKSIHDNGSCFIFTLPTIEQETIHGTDSNSLHR